MKRKLSFFFIKGNKWLYISIFAMAVCPTMISVLMALIKGTLLSEVEVFFANMIGYLIGCVCLCFAFGEALNEEHNCKKALNLLPTQLLNGVLPILAVYTIFEWFLTTLKFQMNLSVYVFMSLIETILLAPAICRLAMASKINEKNLFLKSSSVSFFLRKLLKFIPAMFFYSISKQVGAILSNWLFSMEIFVPLSRQFIMYIFIAILQWLILIPAFKIVVKKVTESTKSTTFSKNEKKKSVVNQSNSKNVLKIKNQLNNNVKNNNGKFGLIADAVYFAIFIGFTVASIYNINTNPKGIDGPNRGYMAISSIDDCIAIGDEAFARNDYITAAMYYDYAKTLVAAWQGYLYDNNLLEETLNANQSDAEIVLLSALATDDSEGYIKRLISENIDTDYLLEALLSIENASGKREALHRLVSRGIVQKRFVFPNTLSEKEIDDLEKALTIADRVVERRGIVKAYYYLFREGATSSKAISIACDLANKYPYDFYLQTLATEIMWYTTEAGSNWVDTDILTRFAEMLMDNTNEDETDKILSLKFFISKIYMNSSKSKEALEFLNTFFPKITNSETDMITISLLHNDGQYDKALDLAQKHAEKYPNDVSNNSYLAIGMLPRNSDVAIESALRLANTIETSKDAEEIAEADAGIGVFLEYIFGYYTAPNSKFCGYKLFYSSEFSEEQKQRLQNNEIIGSYLNLKASKDYNEKINIVNNLINKYISLPYALYERGYSRNQLSQFSDALTDLTKSLELDPMNAFAYIELAVAYEGVGDYAGSLKAVEEMDLVLDELNYSPTINERGIAVYINIFLNNTKHAMYEERTDSLLNNNN